MTIEERLEELRDKGYEAYSNNDYPLAIKCYEEYLSTKRDNKLKFDVDDIQVHEYLIHIYLSNDTYDFVKAISNMKDAASFNAEVSYVLGVINALGINCEPNYEIASNYFDELRSISIHFTHYSDLEHGFPCFINQGNLYYCGINRPIDRFKALYYYTEGLFGQVRLLTERILEQVSEPDKYMNRCEKCYKHFEEFAKAIEHYSEINSNCFSRDDLFREYDEISKLNYEETKKYQDEHKGNIEANLKMVFYYLLNYEKGSNKAKIKQLLKINIVMNDITSAILLYEYYQYLGDDNKMIEAGFKAIDMIKNKIIKMINFELSEGKQNFDLTPAINILETGMKMLKPLVKINKI